ncbi:alpha/beta fold hydrolase [Bosea caraganae]|uniref:Alpha/beta fold hydrolase n=1 Tax=Bosea caraganae TaxID=2763117 RepID=A0A370L089_9HYPH|nr:alpha/beta hydrolase [Bosea caraganae]RDJ20645.1 alpha/beta fold hydrolase [Bosea caraganae]RDJ28922.1 alpha/beta fold hydrolase [Bosea caraganae]
MSHPGPFASDILPAGVRSRLIPDINGMVMHILEAGYETPNRPCVLLVHGFPELAYSWRKVLGPLAEAGYHVIAPDLRGYGRTSGTNPGFDDDLMPWRIVNQVRDLMGLLWALGYRSTEAIVGHDFGAIISAWCAAIRPDVFRRMALMCGPFAGPPDIPFDTDRNPKPQRPDPIHAELAALERPRKHYQRYYTTRPANTDMTQCEQGVHDFLRAYFHHKSGDWKQNKPFRLSGWTASELAKLPTYYVMDIAETMATTAAKEMPSAAEIAACTWLTEDELRVFSGEYERNGFQGGLQNYRVRTENAGQTDLQVFAGRKVEQPSLFVSGDADWAVLQMPGNLERMRDTVCTNFVGCHLLEGAGHWVQQERPEEVTQILRDFLKVPAS